MKIILSVMLLLCIAGINAQTVVTTSGQTFTNTQDTWQGVDIPRTTPTKLTFKNNTITSSNRYGYMLQAGDEAPAATNNNLDGAVITGNKFTWTGSDMTVIPHGLFTGHNKNVMIRYNYLNNVPMGIIRKSGNSMSNTSGGVAYNIIKGGAVGVVVKGMSNVNVFNNTFYNARTPDQTWRPLLHIYTNIDGGRYSVAHGTRIYNNIFYTKNETYAIAVDDEESLTGLECDYNVYWSETGSPRFMVAGSPKSFQEWQAMGYDAHSVVMNPKFRDLVSFVPENRLDYGKDLGAEWKTGLASGASWNGTDPATADQNGTWQVGAVVLSGDGAAGAPEYTGSQVSTSSPDVIEISYSTSLASNIVPPATSFSVLVNNQPRPVKKVALSGTKVLLTLETPVTHTDIVTVSYVKPSVNPLQTNSGVAAETLAFKPVTNNVIKELSVFPNPARKLLNITNIESADLPGTLRIYDISGKLCLEKKLDIDFANKIPISLRPGIYVLIIKLGSSADHVQKLVVIE